MVIVEIYRITTVLKVETDTIASLTAIDTSDNISSKLPSDRLSLFGRSINCLKGKRYSANPSTIY